MRMKFTALFLVFSLLALSGNLIGKEKRGAILIVQKKDGKEIRGELIAVKKNSLLLLVSGKDVAIDIKDVKFIEIEKSKDLEEVGCCSLTGGGIGALLGIMVSSEWYCNRTPVEEAGYLGAIGAGVGLLIGFLTSGKDELIKIEGKSNWKIMAIKQKLRLIARIYDYE